MPYWGVCTVYLLYMISLNKMYVHVTTELMVRTTWSHVVSMQISVWAFLHTVKIISKNEQGKSTWKIEGNKGCINYYKSKKLHWLLQNINSKSEQDKSTWKTCWLYWEYKIKQVVAWITGRSLQNRLHLYGNQCDLYQFLPLPCLIQLLLICITWKFFETNGPP